MGWSVTGESVGRIRAVRLTVHKLFMNSMGSVGWSWLSVAGFLGCWLFIGRRSLEVKKRKPGVDVGNGDTKEPIGNVAGRT